MTKPKNCEMCERETRLNGHHKDYNKPFDVIWVCGSCHRKIHSSNISDWEATTVPVWITPELHHKIKIHCVETMQTMREFTERAIKSRMFKLKNEQLQLL